ncbi:MAG: hypothetical protein IT226_06320 [Flavobacteriales bacterium]|nr:hypothetical protein [Flavobacteriales bacterium]
MRTTLPFLFALLFSAPPLHAQLTAGEVPDGASVVDLGIDLSLFTAFSVDSAALEMDCDDFWDIIAILIQGAPPIDAPNLAMLRFIDDDLEVCANGTEYYHRPKYYSFGEPLDCNSGFDWQLSEQVVLGDFGSFTASGPTIVDSMYVAVRRGEQVGWILLSFRLVGDATIQLQVHQTLSLCFSTSVGSHAQPAALQLHPSLTHGEPIRVESSGALHSIEVLDLSGHVLAQYSGTVRNIGAPEVAGTYLVRSTLADGSMAVGRVVRY